VRSISCQKMVDSHTSSMMTVQYLLSGVTPHSRFSGHVNCLSRSHDPQIQNGSRYLNELQSCDNTIQKVVPVSLNICYVGVNEDANKLLRKLITCVEVCRTEKVSKIKFHSH